ncbi:MAG: hypothetical protein E7255_08735 [Lachnospiraceae bacterium]|jgi:hypothetical protein|nr:hypothetical protein [Lachnospiraceae bacterium]
MQKRKTVVSIILALSLLMSNNYAFAATNEVNSDIIINTHYFLLGEGTTVNSQNSGSSTRGVLYPVGTIKIDDVLGATSGKYQADTKSAVLSKLLSKSFDLIKGIPVIGNIYTTGKDILDWTLAINSDISSVDYTKNATLTTYYSFRNFTHRIYAYNENNQWQDVGYSLSRYYYKHTYSMVYDKSKEDFVSATADYTYTNGYDPEYIAEAANYMNYSTLSSYGNECWLTGKYYREDYY